MFDSIQISKLNDFIFCPKSIYFHGIYGSFDQSLYHQRPQHNGKLKHDNIEKSQYSSSKRYLQGLPVFSQKYNLIGKIDILDTQKAELIERKAKLVKVYDGYKYQLYAQYFCLIEMGYEVKKLKIHSLEDNKNYFISLPNKIEIEKFEKLISDIQNYDILKHQNYFATKEKCNQCIYKTLCH